MGGIFSKFEYGIYFGVGGAVVGGIGGYLLSNGDVQSIIGLASLGGALGFAAGMFIFAPKEKPIGQTIGDTATNIVGGVGNGVGSVLEGAGNGIGSVVNGIGGGIGNVLAGVGGIFKKDR